MKKLLLCSCLAFLQIAAYSQKVYFIYFQTENKEAFYLKMGTKVYSASSSGYLILSKLHDSTYNFNIGFPGGRYAEQPFTVSINKKDHGYLLKNFGDKGWGLFDLQTMAVQMSNTGTSMIEQPKTDNKDVSVFTDILSKVADDPSLKNKIVKPEEVVKAEEPKATVKEEVKPVTELVVKEEPKKEERKPGKKTSDPVKDAVVITEVKKEEPKKEVVLPVSEKEVVKTNPDPVVKENREPVVETVKTEEKPVAEETYHPSTIIRRSEASTTEGLGIVFTDDYGKGVVDTIMIIIPEPKVVAPIIKEEPKEEQKEEKKDDRKFLEMAPADSVKTKTVKAATKGKPKEQPKEIVAVKNCANMASKDDFFKLRKNMASVTTDDAMVDEAKKYFRLKCFTTLQIKNLSALFLDDEGKYKFFDAAYIYVVDPEQYSSLQGELKDAYYIGRFKAMIR